MYVKAGEGPHKPGADADVLPFRITTSWAAAPGRASRGRVGRAGVVPRMTTMPEETPSPEKSYHDWLTEALERDEQTWGALEQKLESLRVKRGDAPPPK